MLKMDWIFAKYGGFDQVGFRELVLALANAPHESLFATELVITLVEHFWSRYYRAIFVRCFIPFVVYFVISIFYLSTYTVDGVPKEERWDFTPEIFMRFGIVVLIIYFFMFEFVSMLRDGWGYLTDVFNYMDITSMFLNFYLLVKT